jgi:hypothetical protein
VKGAAGRIVASVLLGAMRIAGGVLLGAALIAAGAPATAEDRLDRFRELARALDGSDADAPAAASALLDAEIVDNLAAGGVFAAPAFLEERLDAFVAAWGGLAVRVLPLERATVVALSFTELPRGSTVRVYGRRHGTPVLLTALAAEGWPAVWSLPQAGTGAGQFLVAWEGPPTSDGARPLRLEVVREDAQGVRVTWSSARELPGGLTARWYVVRGTDITIRHEARYPGRAPGCPQQAEYEDVYRLPRGGSAYVRASRREHNGWHRELHAAAAGLFAALARGDRGLASLVPDADVRRRLPPTLRHEPACDGPPGRDGTVSLPAVAGALEPWTVTFRREAGRWRLTAAAPMVP